MLERKGKSEKEKVNSKKLITLDLPDLLVQVFCSFLISPSRSPRFPCSERFFLIPPFGGKP
jgi:hypothetical protein